MFDKCNEKTINYMILIFKNNYNKMAITSINQRLLEITIINYV